MKKGLMVLFTVISINCVAQKMDTVRIHDTVNTISIKDGADLLNLYYTKQFGLTVTPQEFDLLKQFFTNLQAITNNKRYKIVPHK